MMKKTLCVLALGIAAAIVSAKTIYVSADSAAGGNGDKDKPFSTIQQGLDAAMPGDTVELAPGVYHEWVKFPRSGEFGKPIRLNGPRSAIIDGVVDFKMNWKKIPQYGIMNPVRDGKNRTPEAVFWSFFQVHDRLSFLLYEYCFL